MIELETAIDNLGATIDEKIDALCDKIQDLRVQLATARNDALEEAARICESRAEGDDGESAWSAIRCADQIRCAIRAAKTEVKSK